MIIANSQNVEAERITAFTAFRAAAESGDFPNDDETASIEQDEFERFLEGLDRIP